MRLINKLAFSCELCPQNDNGIGINFLSIFIQLFSVWLAFVAFDSYVSFGK